MCSLTVETWFQTAELFTFCSSTSMLNIMMKSELRIILEVNRSPIVNRRKLQPEVTKMMYKIIESTEETSQMSVGSAH